MDGETFDNLVKRLTQARLTRLDALRGVLASAAVGLAGATLSAEETVAKKQGKGKGRKGKHGTPHRGKGMGTHAKPDRRAQPTPRPMTRARLRNPGNSTGFPRA